ncbi:uncharacterized protein PRCAT00004211001 [Priceomyces carsonii]|uniref:uncharacterized protein n=1 Tax=Priceomyces carsonii TaxID=28549 RepID=UPI002ED776D1|nr:unnamed protein product [Priceomyces carsonii]
MSRPPLNELLHTSLKNLHFLNTFLLFKEDDYEALLRSTIDCLLDLLDLKGKSFEELKFSVNENQKEIRRASFLCYLNEQESDDDMLDKLNLFDYLRAYDRDGQEHSRSTIIKQLVKALTNERKPTRIKDTYTAILFKLSDLIEFFIRLYTESETQLNRYIRHCYRYEWSYFTKIKHKLESNVDLSEQDTERIRNFLDIIVDDVRSSTPIKDEDNSIFSFGNQNHNISSSDKPRLNLISNDAAFNKLYQLFLQVLNSKNLEGQELIKYVRVMISLYKKHRSITSIELNSYTLKELKLNYFYNFFIGDVNKDGFTILPPEYKAISEKVLYEVFPFPDLSKEHESNITKDAFSPIIKQENDHGVNQTIKTHQDGPHRFESATSSNLSHYLNSNHISITYYSKEDQHKLLLNLRHIVPLLNEFDLNFNLSFPSIMKHYMSLVYDELPDLCEDIDLRYVDALVSLVNCIVDFENEEHIAEGSDIKQTVLELYQLHQYLDEDFRDSSDLTPLMKLALLEFSHRNLIKSNVLKKWNIRTLQISELELSVLQYWVPYSHQSVERKYLKKWFNKKSRFHNLASESSNYYQMGLLHKTFNKMWLLRSFRLKKYDTSADMKFLIRFMKIWQRKLKHMNTTKDMSLDFDKKVLLANTFKKYLENYNYQLSLTKTAVDKHNKLEEKAVVNLVSLVFERWFKKVNSNFALNSGPSPVTTWNEKVLVLSDLEKQFLLKKNFYAWKQKHLIRRKVQTVESKNSKILLEFVFKDQWLKKSRLQLAAAKLTNKRDRNLKLATFRDWNEFKSSKLLASKFFRSNVLSRAFHIWKIQSSYQKSINSSRKLSDRHIVECFFKRWLISHKLKILINKRRFSALSQFRKLWFKRFDEANDMVAFSVTFNELTLVKQAFIKWNLAISKRQEDYVAADLSFKRAFLKRWSSKMHLYSFEMVKTSDEVLSLLDFYNFFLKKQFLLIWQKKYEENFQYGAKFKVQYLNENIILPNLMSRFFIQWVAAFNDTQSKKLQLESRYDHFALHSVSRARIFKNWLQSTRDKSQSAIDAVKFERTLLFKKFLLIWYDQFINKNVYLEELVNEHIDQKQFQKVNDILRYWSMKYIKTIKRNEQTCDLFIERWQNNKLRSVLQLWAQKLEERIHSPKGDDLYVEADTSVFSNQSPLAKKSSRTINTSPEGNRSYIFTPLKLQVTSRSSRSPSWSPSKLQDTTQRIKNERIDALRKHFGRARNPHKFSPNDSSTPGRPDHSRKQIRSISSSSKVFNENDTRFIRLSPPKTKHYNIAPPPQPPNFNVGSESSRFESTAEFSTLIDTYSGPGSAKEDDMSLIETAKKLRRITPIMFPTEDNFAEPKLSPVAKIKERMRKSNISTSSGTSKDLM